ncbi:MAG: glycosyltransferase family 4 protein [Burkholderiaceae bacterium]
MRAPFELPSATQVTGPVTAEAGGHARPVPLRLLIGLQYYLPHRTGYTLHVQRVARALAARGHSVSVLTARHLPQLALRETIDGVDVLRLSAPLRISRGAVMPGYPWHAWRLAAQADAIWISTPLLETSLWAAVARLRRRRLVITHHGDLHLPGGLLNRFIERFTFANYRIAARAADAIVAYSDDYARFSPYLRPYAGKVSVNYPPLEIPRPDPAAVARLRARLAPQGGPVIGFAGRFVREKRPDVLLQAALLLRQRYPGLRIAFAGQHRIGYEDTWQRCGELLAEVGDSAVFLGLIEDAQALADFYAACDVLALPSESECFALVQVEAMLCGTPVVASDIPGARVPVQQTGMGRLCRCGDAQALADGIAAVLEAPERHRRPRDQIEAVFDLERTVDRYEALFAGRPLPSESFA